MSGVTAASQVLVRCATLPPRVGHTFMRHLLRGAAPGTFTGSASDCNSTSSSAAAVAPGHSCHQRLPLSTLFSGSKPCHRALRLLHQRFTSHGKASVICKSTSPMEQHSTRLTETTFPDVVIGKPAQLERKKQAIKAAGLSTLQVIADFDMTLTKYFVNGVRGQSTHALLKSNPVYDLKRHELFEHYYPIEVSPSLPSDEKAKYMEE